MDPSGGLPLDNITVEYYKHHPIVGVDHFLDRPRQTDSEKKLQQELFDTVKRKEKMRTSDMLYTNDNIQPIMVDDIDLSDNSLFPELADVAPVEDNDAPFERGLDGVLRPQGTPQSMQKPVGYLTLEGMWVYPPNRSLVSKMSSPEPENRDEGRFGELPFKKNQLVCLAMSDKTGIIVSKRSGGILNQWCYKVDWLDIRLANSNLEYCHYPETTLQCYVELPRSIPSSQYREKNGPQKWGQYGLMKIMKNNWSDVMVARIQRKDAVLYHGHAFRVVKNDDHNRGIWGIRCDDSIEPYIRLSGTPYGENDAALIYYEEFDTFSNLSKWYWRRWFQLQNKFNPGGAHYDVPPIGTKPQVIEVIDCEHDEEVIVKKRGRKLSETDEREDEQIDYTSGNDVMAIILQRHARLLCASREFIAKQAETMHEMKEFVANELNRLSTSVTALEQNARKRRITPTLVPEVHTKRVQLQPFEVKRRLFTDESGDGETMPKRLHATDHTVAQQQFFDDDDELSEFQRTLNISDGGDEDERENHRQLMCKQWHIINDICD